MRGEFAKLCLETVKNDSKSVVMVGDISHFLLTELLIPKLKKSKDSRIIHTSSVMHERTLVDLDDLNYEKRKYSRIDAYNQSKLAQVLYARYQATLLKKSNITSVSLHPGWVQTPLIKHTLPVFFQDVPQYSPKYQWDYWVSFGALL